MISWEFEASRAQFADPDAEANGAKSSFRLQCQARDGPPTARTGCHGAEASLHGHFGLYWQGKPHGDAVEPTADASAAARQQPFTFTLILRGS